MGGGIGRRIVLVREVDPSRHQAPDIGDNIIKRGSIQIRVQGDACGRVRHDQRADAGLLRRSPRLAP